MLSSRYLMGFLQTMTVDLRWCLMALVMSILLPRLAQSAPEPEEGSSPLKQGVEALEIEEFERAEVLCRQATQEEATREDPEAWLCLGRTLNRLKRGRDALKALSRAEALAVAAERPAVMWRARRLKGRWWCNLGDTEGGAELLQQARRYFREADLHRDEARALLHLGACEFHRGNLAAAGAHYREMLPITQPRGFYAESGGAFEGLSFLANRGGSLIEGLSYARSAEQAYGLAGKHRNQLKATQGQIVTLYWLGRVREARAKMADAVEQAIALGATAHLQSLNGVQAEWLFSEGRPEAALRTIQAVLDELPVDEQGGFINHYIGLRGRAGAEVGHHQQAQADVEKLKRRDTPINRAVIADIQARMATGEEAIASTTDALVLALEELEKEMILKPVQALGFQSNWTRTYDLLVHRLVTLGRLEEVSALLARIKARVLTARVASEGASVQSPSLLPPEGAADEALLDYWLGTYDVLVLLTHRGKRRAFRIPLDPHSLKLMTDQLQMAITEVGQWRAPAEQLGQALLVPLEVLPSTATRLVILPHGLLHEVPWPALLYEGAPLIERYDVAIAPTPALTRSAGNWQELNTVALADPQGDLPNARREADQVARLLDGRSLVLDEAVQSAVFEALERADVVHLAVHGRVNSSGGAYLALPESAAPSAIEISSQRRGGESAEQAATPGLGAWTLAQLAVKARLVSLAGCQTAAAVPLPGGDLMGSLEQALLVAGAEAVLSTLWSVEDRATSKLMTYFYLALPVSGPVSALAEAQRASLYSGDAPSGTLEGPFDRHPIHWAGLRLVGGLRR